MHVWLNEKRSEGAGQGRWTWRRVGTWALLAVVAGAAPVAAASTTATPEPIAQEAEGSAEERGRAALSAVREAKQAAYELEGEAREAALLEVARRYGTVADDAALPAVHRAEGAFRAGEILRSRGLAEEAAGRFAQATTVGAPASDPEARAFAARGLLEQGHLRRRADDQEGALTLYEQVGSRFPEQRRAGAHARTWTGKVLLRQGRLDEASRALLDFDVYLPEYALEAVRNVERLGEALVEEGRPEAAAEALSRLEERLAPLLEDGGTMAQRLHGALTDVRGTVATSGY